MCGGTSAATLLDAQMSLPYTVAVAWLRGAADLAAFAAEVRASAAVREWMGRVRVVSDHDHHQRRRRAGHAACADGSVRTRMIESPIGSWDRPLPDAAIVAKYRALAAPVLGEARAEALQEAVWALGTGVSPHHLAALCGRADVAPAAELTGNPGLEA